MNRKELMQQVSERTGMPVTRVDVVLTALIDEIHHQLGRGEHVKVKGLGTFEVRPRRPRVSRDPNTGAGVSVPARLAPAFRPSLMLKKSVNDD